MKKVSLFVNHNDKAQKVATLLEKELLNQNFVFSKKPEIGISVGGDGAFLRMVKKCKFDTKLYYVGINAGTLGFLQEIDVNRMKDFVERLSREDYKIEQINLIEIIVTTKEKRYVLTALNEIVVRNQSFRTVKLNVQIDRELLEHYVGDGILISSSTGSTAYNMSFGGAIVYNTLDTLQITPIAPIKNKVYQTLANSLIVPSDKHISLIPENDEQDFFLSLDGVSHIYKNVTNIEVKVSSKKLNVIRMQDFHFIRVVREKLLD